MTTSIDGELLPSYLRSSVLKFCEVTVLMDACESLRLRGAKVALFALMAWTAAALCGRCDMLVTK